MAIVIVLVKFLMDLKTDIEVAKYLLEAYKHGIKLYQ